MVILVGIEKVFGLWTSVWGFCPGLDLGPVLKTNAQWACTGQDSSQDPLEVPMRLRIMD